MWLYRLPLPVLWLFSAMAVIFTTLMIRGEFGRYEAELAEQRALAAQVIPTRDVYVAGRQLKYGEQLTPKDVRLQRWPEEALPPGAFLADEQSLFPKGGPEFGRCSA